MFQDLSDDAIEMNLSKDIDEMLLQANMVELKKVASIMKTNLDEKENLQLRQLLRILQAQVDKVKDLLVVDGIKQILFDMIQAKQTAQQSKDNQNGTGAVGKGNFVADILGGLEFGSEISAFCKNFKIRGAIEEADQKVKPSYVSSIKQIVEGKDKDYSDKEIVNPVIKAITPGLYLPNVLETTDNLTLDQVMKFLQSHFVERNTLDLSQHLTSLTQGQQEPATHFIYRAMSLRQTLVLASKSPVAEISYDEPMAQNLFLKSVETGLSNECILSEIKLLLRDLTTSDEDLIFSVGQTSRADSQRLSKISKVKGSNGRVNMLNLSRSVPKECDEKLLSKPSTNKAGGDEALTELLKSMQKQLNSIQGQVKDMKLHNKTSRHVLIVLYLGMRDILLEGVHRRETARD